VESQTPAEQAARRPRLTERRLALFLCVALLSAIALAFAQVARPDPKFIEHMRAGLEARKEQRWEDAAREFEAAVRIAPKVAEAHANLGLIRHRQGNMSAAATAFEKALELRPDLKGVHGLLGFAVLMLGRVEAAEKHLEKALQEEPGNPRLDSWLGLAYLESSQFRKAISKWEAVRSSGPPDINILLYLVRAYEGRLSELHDQLYRLDPIRARVELPETKEFVRPARPAEPKPGAAQPDYRRQVAKWEAALQSKPEDVETVIGLSRACQGVLDQLRDEIYRMDPQKAEAAFGSGAAPAPLARTGEAKPGGILPGAAGRREPQIRESCTQCHRLPPPGILPKRAWPGKVEKMFSLANVGLLPKFGRPIKNVGLEEVVAYFQTLAPEELDTPPWGPPAPDPGLKFERRSLRGVPPGENLPGAANLRLLDLFDDIPGPELVVCDMFSGWVSWTDPKNPKMGLQGLARLTAPDHVEAVDLDKDGRMDLLVSDLGQVIPSDKRLGSVVWLRRTGPRQFEVIRIARNLGRVADAQAADFDGDGDLDIVSAVFGWITVGEILYLENRSEPGGGLPSFTPRTLDDRVGSIHVPVVDLNKDGRPDFLALISQHHETVVAFLNRGKGQFERRELFTAPHPHWGFSGMEPVDFDMDGDLDVLLSYGDTMDDMIRFKPYQGVSWLENRGAFPFVHHVIGHYYGVARAESGDLDGDGDLDVVASSWLPELDEAQRRSLKLPGIVWYERKPDGSFVAHIFSDDYCDRPTLEVGDIDGDGRLDVITGTAWLGQPPAGRTPIAVDIWRQIPR